MVKIWQKYELIVWRVMLKYYSVHVPGPYMSSPCCAWIQVSPYIGIDTYDHPLRPEDDIDG